MIKIEWKEFWNDEDGYGADLIVNGTKVTHLLYAPISGWEIFGIIYGTEHDDLKDTLKSVLESQKDINSLPNDEASRKKVMDFIESIVRLELT